MINHTVAVQKILIAEDQAKLTDALREELTKEGYEVEIAQDGRMAELLFKQRKFDLVLLDINLPYKSGYELVQIYRKTDEKVPIIMLTALGELDDKMEAFNKGADDYIVKPFHVKELLARINVFLKRRGAESIKENDKLAFGDLTIDFDSKSVVRAGTAINLTSREFALFEALVRNNGKVLSKAQLSEQVWGIDFDTGTNTVEVYISFLRNKLDKPFEHKFIQTKQGFGYYFKEN
ncbi:MAG TPA: response regulator transcription factor [Chitinophagales bacterium]